MDFTFKRTERLKNKSVISQLFKKGKSKSIFPFRIVWLERSSDETSHSSIVKPTSFPVQVVVSVPKRNFGKATDRNRIKRQIREAYRLNKHLLYEGLESSNTHLALMVIYVGKKPLSFDTINYKMIGVIRYLSKRYRAK
ncbi:MAG: ribonuclease P protein component [Chitinophagales bacterium]